MKEYNLSFSAKIWFVCVVITGAYTAQKVFEFTDPSMLIVSTLALLPLSAVLIIFRVSKSQIYSQPSIIHLFDYRILTISLMTFLVSFGSFFIGRTLPGILGLFILMQ